MTRFAVALCHHPCLDKNGDVFTTSITNLDIHDIARSSSTYGVDALYVVTPVSAQRTMAERIAEYWEEGQGQARRPTRTRAMRIVHVVASIEDAARMEEEAAGKRPTVVVTSAKEQGSVTCADFRARMGSLPGVLLLFGTGHGLAQSVVDGADVVLEPLRGATSRNGGFNHLSVRSAAAIFLDRLLG